MEKVISAIDGIIPISQFNRGLAGKIFSDVKTTGPKVVIKNNMPECVLLSPEDYSLIIEGKENTHDKGSRTSTTLNDSFNGYSNVKQQHEMGEEEYAFVMFLIHELAESWNMLPNRVYRILSKTNCITNYLVPHYEVLHTQGTDFVVKDIEEYIGFKGGAV